MEKNYTDTLSPAGAEAIASRITEYWRAKGFDVATRIESLAVLNAEGEKTGTVFCVRSDMVGGKPSRPLFAEAA